MRDNARRLLTILTVIPALWLVLGFWPLSIGNRGDLQSVHPAGGRRGALASASPGSQPSAIGNRPAARGFSGAVVLLCGDTDGLFPGRSAHGETRHGWYLRGDSAEQLPGLAQYLGGGASGAGIAGFRAAGGGTGAPPLRGASGAVAARLAAEYRPVPNPAKRSAAGVERVLGDAAGAAEAVESRWFTVTPERAGLRCSRRDKRPSRLPGGSGRAALPHACIRRCGWRAFCPWPKTLCSGHSAPGRRNFLR